MAGAMIPGRCVPLRDWPVAPLKTDAAPRTQVRHCWVGGSVEDLGPWPGLVLEWRTDQAAGWSALVVCAITAQSATTSVQTWVPAGQLRPSLRFVTRLDLT
jgi:hypothetical protein